VTARRALIAGGGLGGLTAAVALHQRGWQVCVFEQAPTLEPIGAGISLWPNALRALDQIGVGKQARAQATLAGPSGVRVPDGRWLSRSDVGAEVQARFGDPLVLMHRAELAQLLVEQLPFGAVQAATSVLGVHIGADADAAPATLIHQHGETEAELVVAADGIRSVLRGFLYPQYSGPSYAGYTAWRMVLPNPTNGTGDDTAGGPQATGFETWGTDGRRFAALPLSGNRLYCYATATTAPGRTSDDELAELTRLFGDWHAPIPQILAALRPDQVLHSDVEELLAPLPAYNRGRVALVGDAAHAMTPDLGQGGGMAIEDAVVLAHLLGDSSDGATGARPVVPTLHEYTQARLARTSMVARRSRRAGRMYSAPYGAQVLAARLVGRLPGPAMARGLGTVVDWRPPTS
jgi:2-polyprenyl-6-methoxyphenol hydroxylase-like FAD-dependent oxidoreductase